MGKLLGPALPPPPGRRPGTLVAASAARLALLPVAALCCWPRPRAWLAGPGWAGGVAAAAGLTNGYLGSLPLVLAPQGLAPRLRELGGHAMMAAFTLALAAGTGTSYALVALVGP